MVTNQDLHDEFPNWDIDRVVKKSGVLKRHIATKNETALDLSIKACEKLFSNESKEDIDGIIYCTQSPDYIMPSNCFFLQDHLNLSEDIFALDFNHACTGYIYSLAIAHSFLLSGLGRKILLVNADTYSKYINKNDRSTRVLFGDGAAVSIIESTKSQSGIIDIDLASRGKGYDKFWIQAGGLRIPKSKETSVELRDKSGNVRSKNDITMDGMEVWSFINSVAPKQILSLLERNNLNKSEVSLFIFHQASKMTLDSLMRILQLENDQFFTNIKEIGNTVSASIPIAIKDAMDQGKLKKGQHVVLSGFGVGLSYGTILMKI